MKKKYKLRTCERMLNPKQLSEKCSVSPGLALFERQRQIDEGNLDHKAWKMSVLLYFFLPVFIIGLLINADSVFTLLGGMVIAVLLFLLAALWNPPIQDTLLYSGRRCAMLSRTCQRLP